VAHALDVQATRGDVRGHEHWQLALLEVGEDAQPPLLVDVAGEGTSLPAVAAQPVLEPPRLLARVGEDEDAAAALALEQAEEQRELLVAPHVVEHLLGLLHRLLLGGDGDLGGVVHELPRQLHHPERQRGREQERLPALRPGQPAQDEAQVRDEAHVEHPVGLVDHQHFNAAGRPDVLLQVVDEAPRRAHEHVAALAERLTLLVVVDAAVDGEHAEAGVRAEEPRVGLDLHDQLPRGGDDQHARRGGAAPRRRGVAEAAREGGDQERRGLPRSRLRLARHVLVLEGERQGRLLDRRGGGEAGVADALEDGLGQVERRELEGAHASSPWLAGAASVSAGTAFGLRAKIHAEMMPTS
jgi:hypothetical protein